MRNSILAMALASMTFSFSLAAKVATLATMYNDAPNTKHEVIQINIEVDDQNSIRSFSFHKWDTITKQEIYTVAFNLNDLRSKIPLEPAGDSYLFNLSSPTFSPDNGGVIDIDFLSNGVVGARETTRMKVAKRENKWRLLSSNVEINTLYIKTKKFFGKIIGIDYLMCKDAKTDSSWKLLR